MTWTDTALVLLDTKEHIKELLVNECEKWGVPVAKVYGYSKEKMTGVICPAIDIQSGSPPDRTTRPIRGDNDFLEHHLVFQVWYYGAQFEAGRKYDEIVEILNKIQKYLIENPTLPNFTTTTYPKGGEILIWEEPVTIGDLQLLEGGIVGGYVEFTVRVFQKYTVSS